MSGAQSIRHAFARRHSRLVRVAPDGFHIDHEIHSEITGHVVKTALLRKRFEDSLLVCHSQDGITAADGTACDRCRHPQCRPQIRCHLADANLVYIIDLAITSAENLIALEDQATQRGERLENWRLRLTVVNRGYWGEVVFERSR